MLARCVLPKRLYWQQTLADLVRKSRARFIVAILGRRAGKTTIAADLAGEVTLETGGDVFWGAPTYDLSEIGRELFKDFYRGACAKINNSKPPSARMLNGAHVRWRSFDRPGAAIGRGTELVIIDEAARVKKQILQEEILPTIADTGGKILAITTPRGRRNWAYKWYRKAVSGDPLYAFVHGPSTANPNPKIKEFIRECRSEFLPHLYEQEILAQFIEGEGAVFRNIDVCATLIRFLDKPPSPDAEYIIGCDLAKHQDWTVLVAIHIETGEVHGFLRFNLLDWPLQEQKIIAFGKLWNDAEIWIDATGIGDVVTDHLVEMDCPIVPIKFTNDSKANLITALSTSLDAKDIAYPNDELVKGELEAMEYEILPSGRFRYAAADDNHDDIAIALALACYGRNQTVTGVVA